MTVNKSEFQHCKELTELVQKKLEKEYSLYGSSSRYSQAFISIVFEEALRHMEAINELKSDAPHLFNDTNVGYIDFLKDSIEKNKGKISKSSASTSKVHERVDTLLAFIEKGGEPKVDKQRIVLLSAMALFIGYAGWGGYKNGDTIERYLGTSQEEISPERSEKLSKKDNKKILTGVRKFQASPFIYIVGGVVSVVVILALISWPESKTYPSFSVNNFHTDWDNNTIELELQFLNPTEGSYSIEDCSLRLYQETILRDYGFGMIGAKILEAPEEIILIPEKPQKVKLKYQFNLKGSMANKQRLKLDEEIKVALALNYYDASNQYTQDIQEIAYLRINKSSKGGGAKRKRHYLDGDSSWEKLITLDN